MDDLIQQEQAFLSLAKAQGLTPAQLKQHLAVLGWKALQLEAERMAQAAASRSETSDASDHLAAAARTLLHTAQELPRESPASKEDGPGYLYVLHDGKAHLAQIGWTQIEPQHQQAFLNARGTVLAHVLTARVNDMRSAAEQCQQYFGITDRLGEWWNVDLDELINFIAREVDWEALSTTRDARMFQYLEACRHGDMEMARFALTGPSFPVPKLEL